MNEEFVQLPHFKIEGNAVLFLEQHPYLKFDRKLTMSDPICRKVLIDEGVFIRRRTADRAEVAGEHVLVLEPHPDDFAFSCSGYVISKMQDGAQLAVLNVFSKSTLSTFPWNSVVSITETEYEALRLRESRMVVEDLLCSSFASYRLQLALNRGHRSVFEALNHTDIKLIDELSKKVEDELHGRDTATLVAPLAIGNHIDHVIVHEAALKVRRQNKKIKLILYEDMPYARNRPAYYERMMQVKSRLKLIPIYSEISDRIETMTDLASIYRSQLDDTNRIQMLALMKEDARITAAEGNSLGGRLDGAFYQRVYEGRILQ